MSYKVVLITGASSGIGRACAERLVEQGHRVYGTSRTSSFKPTDFTSIKMDVTDENSIRTGIDEIIEREGHIDVVVNNAGYGLAGPIEETTLEEAYRQLDVNFMAPLRVCRVVLPHMRKRRFGTIINISSLAGLFGIPFQGIYSASKFALEGLSESLRYEVTPFGIRVVLIEPGDVQTNITSNRQISSSATNGEYAEQFRRVLEIIEREEQAGADPKRIARLVCKIINGNSRRFRYTSGQWSQQLSVILKRLAPYAFFERVIGDFYSTARPQRDGNGNMRADNIDRV